MAVLMTKDEIVDAIRSRVFARKVVTGEGRDSREDLVVDGIENAADAIWVMLQVRKARSETIAADRVAASEAMLKGHHDCWAHWQGGPVRACHCDYSRIDGCAARIEAIAVRIAEARTSGAMIQQHG